MIKIVFFSLSLLAVLGDDGEPFSPLHHFGSVIKYGTPRHFLAENPGEEPQPHQQQHQLRSAGSVVAGGRNKVNSRQQKKQAPPKDYTHFEDTDHGDYDDYDVHPSDGTLLDIDDDFYGHDLPQYSQEITSIPDRGRGPPLIGSRSGSRGTDIYVVRESGDRRDNTRGRGSIINMLHTKNKVFRPHISIVHDETRLATSNDGYSRDCTNVCGDIQWQCVSTCTCIQSGQRCDKIPQCHDGSDEYDCEAVDDNFAKLSKECEQTGLHTICPKTYRCINKDWLCDGDDDCGDYSDETQCGERAKCTDDQFECDNRFCVPKEWICDGENDCRDFSDESHCNHTRYVHCTQLLILLSDEKLKMLHKSLAVAPVNTLPATKDVAFPWPFVVMANRIVLIARMSSNVQQLSTVVPRASSSVVVVWVVPKDLADVVF